MLFDLHAHFSFKPAHSTNYASGVEPDPDYWRERIRKSSEFSMLAAVFDKTVIKSSQTNGDFLTTGAHRIIVNSYYPLERGFIRGLPVEEIGTLSGFSKATLRKINNLQISYIQLLENEHQSLLSNENSNAHSANGNRYFVCDNYADLMLRLKQDPQNLCIINSIEGAHSFGDLVMNGPGVPVGISDEKKHIRSIFNQTGGDAKFKTLIQSIADNIDHVKKTWTKHPFFVGVSHHYYNHLAGHSESLANIVDLLLNQDGATLDALDPTLPLRYYAVGIHPWGKGIIQKLLSRTAGGTAVRRYLIDVKHMSPKARVDFYAFLDLHHQNNPNDRIPIIKSHTAVAGLPSVNAAADDPTGVKGGNKYFYSKMINLFDDEIIKIVSSDGIMGLMIDERRIMGRKIPPESGFPLKRPFNKIAKKVGAALNQIVKNKHQRQWLIDELANNPPDPGKIQERIDRCTQTITEKQQFIASEIPKIRNTYLSILFRQIFHIIELTGEQGWNHICLGSDYDGVINPIDIYPTSAEIGSLKMDLLLFWSQNINHPNSEIRTLYNKYLFGKTPEHWLKKFSVLNGMNFLKKYFTKDYLEKGIVPPRGWILTSQEEAFLAPTMV